MRVLFLILVATTIFLTACSNGEEDVKNVVRSVLIDPDSAKFKDFVTNADSTQACIGVNAKNKMGGYTGFNYFELKKISSEWRVTNTEGKFANCTKKHFRIRDEFKEFLKKYPNYEIQDVTYLPDDLLIELMASQERVMASSESLIKELRQKGMTKEEINKVLQQMEERAHKRLSEQQ